jgi:hypothetical protein
MEWKELMKSFPVTTSTVGNERLKTTKEIIIVAHKDLELFPKA